MIHCDTPFSLFKPHACRKGTYRSTEKKEEQGHVKVLRTRGRGRGTLTKKEEDEDLVRDVSDQPSPPGDDSDKDTDTDTVGSSKLRNLYEAVRAATPSRRSERIHSKHAGHRKPADQR